MQGRAVELPARPEEGRLLSGVCAGLSLAFQVDVTLVRLAFLVLALAWGGGIILYFLLLLLMPDERMGRTDRLEDVVRNNLQHLTELSRELPGRFQNAYRVRSSGRSWPRPLDRRFMAMGLVGVGLLLFMTSIGAFGWLTPLRGLGLAMIAVGLSVFVHMRGDRA